MSQQDLSISSFKLCLKTSRNIFRLELPVWIWLLFFFFQSYPKFCICISITIDLRICSEDNHFLLVQKVIDLIHKFQAVQNAVTIFGKFCHARWDQLKTESTKEGLIINSFLELVTDSRSEPGKITFSSLFSIMIF